MESLLRHLILQPMTIGGPSRVRTHDFAQYREHLSTWNESAFNVPASQLTPAGIAPDILVQETVADVRAGRDVTLERALQ